MSNTSVPIELSSTPGIVDNSNATAITIDSNENVGIGVVPEAWLSSYDALQIGASGSIAGISSGNENVFIFSNAYIATDGNYKYIATNEASRYLQSAGVHYFSNVASGTADTNITWNDRMVIDLSGNVGIGTSPTQKLDVDGNISMSGAGTGSRYVVLGNETNTYAGSLTIQAGGGSAAYGGGLIAYGHSHASKAGDVVAGISSGSGGSFRVNTSGIDTGSDVFVVEASGDVVIGSGGLDVSGIGGTYTALNIRAGSGYPVLYGQTTATTSNSAAMQIVGATSGASAGGAAEMLGVIQIAAESDSSTNGTGYINFYTGSGGSVTERMRINSSGNLLAGATYDGFNSRIVAYASGSGSQVRSFTAWNLGGSGCYYFFCVNSAGQGIGSITQNGTSAVSYNTSSDYRLKENVEYDWDATTRLKQLKPARFNFIADADKTVDGFLAHEVSSIVPEAIHGEKDEVDDEGNPKYQGIDQSKLVPLLVKTIQELEARITALETMTIIEDLEIRLNAAQETISQLDSRIQALEE